MMHFHERIKRFRKQKDMTQEQLAGYMCVSPQAISRWETGVTCPDISALPQLAELFGITVDELLGINEKEKRREIKEIIADAEEKIDQGETEDGELCKEYDAEIVSIAYRIENACIGYC